MRHEGKSNLLDCLPRQKTVITQHPSVDCVVIDGAATVQMPKPGLNMTLSVYANELYRDHTEQYFNYTKSELTLFSYVYMPNSLKSDAKSQRVAGF
jgi:hypothetical protein